MAEDLLDYWVRLIKNIFPANAWINSLFSENDYVIQIDWKLQNDSENPTKRSKRIVIIVKEITINDYLDKNKKDREVSDIMLAKFIRERFNHFVLDNGIDASQHAAAEKWLVSKDVMNGKPPFDIPLADQPGLATHWHPGT